MAVRRIVRKLSSKCAIDTPITCRAREARSPQPGDAATIKNAANTTAHRTVTLDTVPPLWKSSHRCIQPRKREPTNDTNDLFRDFVVSWRLGLPDKHSLGSRH